MFDTFLVQPIFNVLTFVYAIIPGHDFGIALIIFTILARLALWPLVRKQLHHTKALRELQPELKKIKEQTKGDRQKEAMLTMALYKERQVSPFSSMGLLIIQLPLLFALFAGINKIVHDPQTVVDFSYSWIQNLGWMKELAADIGKFDNSFFGVVDLTRKAVDNGIYWPAMLIVLGSTVTQYYTSKQLMVTDKNSRTLRQILKDTSKTGQQADQAEVSAAVSKSMRFIIPGMIFVISISISAAISLYWFVGGLVAFFQQRAVLGQDQVEIEASVNKVSVKAEVVEKPKTKKSGKKGGKSNKKRRR